MRTIIVNKCVSWWVSRIQLFSRLFVGRAQLRDTRYENFTYSSNNTKGEQHSVP